jgi:hypothetical protein
MKIMKNANAERLIKTIVSKEILELKPIIAGGFIVNLYHRFIRYSSPKYDLDLSKQLDDLLVESNNIWRYNTFGLKKFLKIDDYGDVDIWFHSDNPIWKEEHSANFLLRNYYKDGLHGPRDKDQFSWDAPVLRHPEGFDIATSDMIKSGLLGLHIGEELIKSTQWANTFHLPKIGMPLQLIKKPFSGAQELFDNFDLINCCAAYYDGKFCFHDDFEKSYDNKVLTAKLDFDEISVMRKIWIVNRTFKYAKRYDLEPDKETCEKIFETYSEAADVYKLILQGQYKGNVIEIEKYAIEDPYGRSTLSVDLVKYSVGDIMSKFSTFAKFKHYDPVYAAFLLNSGVRELDLAIQELMTPEEERDKKSDDLMFNF